jgi:hypothetical protein
MVLMGVPVILIALASASAWAGSRAAAEVLTLAAFALLIVGFGLIVGYRDEGFVECRVEKDGVRIAAATGAAQWLPMTELGPPRVEARETFTDLLIIDCYGDAVLRLRGESHAEREAIGHVVDALRDRLGT